MLENYAASVNISWESWGIILKLLGKVMGIMGFFREKVLDTLQQSKKNEKPTTGQV